MNMPVVALLWPDHAKREPDTVLRMLEVLERRCLEMGADEAAGHLAEAMGGAVKPCEPKPGLGAGFILALPRYRA